MGRQLHHSLILHSPSSTFSTPTSTSSCTSYLPLLVTLNCTLLRPSFFNLTEPSTPFHHILTSTTSYLQLSPFYISRPPSRLILTASITSGSELPIHQDSTSRISSSPVLVSTITQDSESSQQSPITLIASNYNETFLIRSTKNKIHFPASSPKMSQQFNGQKKALAQLDMSNVKIASPTLDTTIDSAVDMTFPASVKNDLAKFEGSDNENKMGSHNIASSASVPNNMSSTSNSTFIFVEGMPYTYERIMEMGAALAKARRERMFPPTITPNYNLKAIIDDYEDLERLNIAREDAKDPRDDAFRPDISRLYISIQRRIQDRDLTHGEVAAESNVRARLSGLANGTGAETGMYNLMRHAVNSVLRLNNLALDSESNLVDAVAARVIREIRSDVQARVARGEHNVEGVDMNGVMEDVFNAINKSLAQGVGAQANRLDGQYNRVDSQINAIAGHVNAIDNHAHAMGNNVNAMGSLVNSTNGNVTALSTNVGALQTIVNMLPQMVANAVRDMLPGIVGPAVEQAFEGAISNELIARLQVFTNAVQEARARAEASNQTRGNHGRNWFRLFKKGSGRHGGSMN